MDNQVLQNLRDTIDKSDQIAVAVGENPTLDQMAGMLALYLTLQAAGKKVTAISASEPIVAVSSLVGIDHVKTQFASESGDLIVSFPYVEGEIDKVSYTMDDNYLNIVVKAGENGLSFDENSVKYSRGATSPQLLFVVGTPQVDIINRLISPDLLADATIVNIDNSEDNERFGDIVLVSPRFSSLSEQVADLLLSLGFEIDQDVAQNLLNGVMDGTSNFQNPDTSYLAFEIASILMKRGAMRQTMGGRGTSSEQNNRSRFFPRGGNNQAAQSTQPVRPAQTQPRPQVNRPQPPVTPAPQPEVEEEENTSDQNQPAGNGGTPPSDWLTPKVYKGSSNV